MSDLLLFRLSKAKSVQCQKWIRKNEGELKCRIFYSFFHTDELFSCTMNSKKNNNSIKLLSWKKTFCTSVFFYFNLKFWNCYAVSAMRLLQLRKMFIEIVAFIVFDVFQPNRHNNGFIINSFTARMYQIFFFARSIVLASFSLRLRFFLLNFLIRLLLLFFL